jgi:hypothetical protein
MQLNVGCTINEAAAHLPLPRWPSSPLLLPCCMGCIGHAMMRPAQCTWKTGGRRNASSRRVCSCRSWSNPERSVSRCCIEQLEFMPWTGGGGLLNRVLCPTHFDCFAMHVRRTCASTDATQQQMTQHIGLRCFLWSSILLLIDN